MRCIALWLSQGMNYQYKPTFSNKTIYTYCGSVARARLCNFVRYVTRLNNMYFRRTVVLLRIERSALQRFKRVIALLVKLLKFPFKSTTPSNISLTIDCNCLRSCVYVWHCLQSAGFMLGTVLLTMKSMLQFFSLIRLVVYYFFIFLFLSASSGVS